MRLVRAALAPPPRRVEPHQSPGCVARQVIRGALGHRNFQLLALQVAFEAIPMDGRFARPEDNFLAGVGRDQLDQQPVAASGNADVEQFDRSRSFNVTP